MITEFLALIRGQTVKYRIYFEYPSFCSDVSDTVLSSFDVVVYSIIPLSVTRLYNIAPVAIAPKQEPFFGDRSATKVFLSQYFTIVAKN